MKNIFKKICLLVAIGVALIFMIYVFFVVNSDGILVNTVGSVTKVLFGIFGGLFLLASLYLLFVTFNDSDENLRQMVLFSDNNSTTRVSVKSLKKLVIQSAKEVEGVKILKLKIKQDNKYCFKLLVKINVRKTNVEHTVDVLRCLIADNCYTSLGIRFNSIDFDIKHLTPAIKPNKQKATKQAKDIKDMRDCSKDYVYNSMDKVYEQAEELTEQLNEKQDEAIIDDVPIHSEQADNAEQEEQIVEAEAETDQAEQEGQIEADKQADNTFEQGETKDNDKQSDEENKL